VLDFFAILGSNSAENAITRLRVWAAKDGRTNFLWELCWICSRDQCCTLSYNAR